jgi:hypothetical protein
MAEENRHKFARDSINAPTPCDGTGAAPPRSHNDLPMSIRGDQPLCLDPHAAGRHSYDNMAVKPGEKSRSSYAAEARRRLRPGSGDTYK